MENFEAWREEGPNVDKISQSSARALWTNLLMTDDCFLWKQYFSGTTFEHKFAFSFHADTKVNSYLLYVFLWMVSENKGGTPWWGTYDVGQNVNIGITEIGHIDKFRVYIEDNAGGEDGWDYSVYLDCDTTYYVTIQRTDGYIEARIYSDEDRTSLIDTIWVNIGATVTFNYISVTIGPDYPSGVYQCDGYIENLDLGVPVDFGDDLILRRGTPAECGRILEWREAKGRTVPVKRIYSKCSPTIQAQFHTSEPLAYIITYRATNSEKSSMETLVGQCAPHRLFLGSTFLNNIWIDDVSYRDAKKEMIKKPWIITITLTIYRE